jgi:hypothetical protein
MRRDANATEVARATPSDESPRDDPISFGSRAIVLCGAVRCGVQWGLVAFKLRYTLMGYKKCIQDVDYEMRAYVWRG